MIIHLQYKNMHKIISRLVLLPIKSLFGKNSQILSWYTRTPLPLLANVTLVQQKNNKRSMTSTKISEFVER